ncbi:MAG: hypothetical protein PHV28_16565, partial [Kiritimatiellae bacterium]|nr:hypothetical protein [Kiritimatiellia bacterium]
RRRQKPARQKPRRPQDGSGNRPTLLRFYLISPKNHQQNCHAPKVAGDISGTVSGTWGTVVKTD